MKCTLDIQHAILPNPNVSFRDTLQQVEENTLMMAVVMVGPKQRPLYPRLTSVTIAFNCGHIRLRDNCSETAADMVSP